VPVAPPVTVSQVALLVAVHPQPSAVRTSNVPPPPPAGTDPEAADSMVVQPCPWLTVNVRPAIVSVPDRLGPLVAATVKLTVPFPEPLAPDVMVIHETFRVAVQAQPAPPVTATEPLPPDDGTDRVSGEMLNAQPFPCVTETVWFATTRVPDREGPLAGATANVTVPGPLPLAPDVIVIHG
jgi:hypothetical protein